MLIQLKIRWCVYLCMISLLSCNGQQQGKTTKGDSTKTNNKLIKSNMKKLDITEFERSKTHVTDKTAELVKNDTLFKFSEDNQTIRKESAKAGENTKINEIFDKKSLSIIAEGKTFFNMPIGVYREYDPQGKVTKETDYDKNFKFSLDEVISLSKTKFKVDLNQKIARLNVSRGMDEDTKKNVYFLFLPVNDQSYRLVKIDAENGKIISDKPGMYIE